MKDNNSEFTKTLRDFFLDKQIAPKELMKQRLFIQSHVNKGTLNAQDKNYQNYRCNKWRCDLGHPDRAPRFFIEDLEVACKISKKKPNDILLSLSERKEPIVYIDEVMIKKLEDICANKKYAYFMNEFFIPIKYHESSGTMLAAIQTNPQSSTKIDSNTFSWVKKDIKQFSELRFIVFSTRSIGERSRYELYSKPSIPHIFCNNKYKTANDKFSEYCKFEEDVNFHTSLTYKLGELTYHMSAEHDVEKKDKIEELLRKQRFFYCFYPYLISKAKRSESRKIELKTHIANNLN